LTGGLSLGIRLRFHHHAPEQLSIRLPFHQQAADEFGCNLLGGAGEEGLGEMVWELLGGRGGYGSGYGRQLILLSAWKSEPTLKEEP